MPNLASQFSVPVYALYDSNGNYLGIYAQNGNQVPSVLSALSVAGLPKTLPSSSGILWNNGGVLSIS